MNNISFKGVLFGVAVGDALGATLEFVPRSKVKQKYGELREIIGGGWLNLQPGQVTDDTEMTICTARGIMKRPLDPVMQIMYEYERWYRKGPKDVGCTISAALSYFCETGRIKPSSTSKSNGVLMRISPLAAYPFGMLEDVTERVTLLTHQDKLVIDCSLFYTILLRKTLFNDFSPMTRHISNSEITKMLAKLSKNKMPESSSGYVLDTLYCALWALKTTSNFEDAIVAAVNLGGDADTIGAVTGALAGAKYGFDAIPKRWVNALRIKKKLSEFCDKFDEVVSFVNTL